MALDERGRFKCECGSVDFIAVDRVSAKVPFEVQIKPQADEPLTVMGITAAQDIEVDDDPDEGQVEHYECMGCGKEYAAEEVFDEAP